MKNYIIRFKDKIEIKTIKVSDTESMKYFIDILEEKNIQYVVIKNLNTKRTDFELKSLLDYEEKL